MASRHGTTRGGRGSGGLRTPGRPGRPGGPTRRVAVAAGAVAALGLAACGSSGGTTAATPSASAVAPASTSAAAGTVPPTTGAGASSTGATAGPTATATAAANPATSPAAVGAASTWPGYHADAARTGAVAAIPALDPATRAWSVDLGAAVFGQPVAAGGHVIAATEGNRVVALDPATGRQVWAVSLGTPLTDVDAAAGCGNIDPLGITSTPVVDPATGTVYVVGEVSDGGGAVHHQLTGLDVATGAVRLSEPVDPPLPDGEKAVNLLQRASLALANGRVYVSYGGNSGDCGSYHGWVVGVMATGAPRLVSFEVAADGEGGAIWQSGGAPAVDAQGHLYVTTGNANPDPPQGGPDPKQDTESVVELTPDLTRVAAFKDRVAGGDEDLSTSSPVLLPDGTVFATGKTEIGFLLRQGTLAQVAAIPDVCGSDPDGGPAYDRADDRLFVPCRDGGIQVVELSSRRLGPLLSGANGAPILVGTRVWAAQYPEGSLTEYDAASGRTLQTVSVGTTLPHFASPSAALGLLLIGTDHGVTAFR